MALLFLRRTSSWYVSVTPTFYGTRVGVLEDVNVKIWGTSMIWNAGEKKKWARAGVSEQCTYVPSHFRVLIEMGLLRQQKVPLNFQWFRIRVFRSRLYLWWAQININRFSRWTKTHYAVGGVKALSKSHWLLRARYSLLPGPGHQIQSRTTNFILEIFRVISTAMPCPSEDLGIGGSGSGSKVCMHLSKPAFVSDDYLPVEVEEKTEHLDLDANDSWY